jgi:flagellar basal body-associated protein FliL
MKEDPLERLEREEREKKNGGLKTVMYALAAVAVLLAGALAYVWFQKSSLVKDLNIEKEELTEQIVALQQDYDNLSSDYEAINSQLDSSREEVSQLVERIKQTDATNRAKMRQYEKELGTLRSIMRNYIVQIDSLNTLNQQLQADADAARKDAASSRRQNEQLNKQVNELSGQVAAGSVIKARGIILEPYSAQDKVTDRSSRVVRMLTTLSLVENDLAPKGPVRVYIVVKGPDGTILTNANSTGFESAGEARTASASREVDYEGKEVELSIYLNDLTDRCVKGVYTVEAYTSQGYLGSAETMLR